MDPVDDLISGTGQNSLLAMFWAAAIVSLALPHIPYGRTVLYPFSLMSTWAHELGHGVFALLAGGSFRKLLIFSNLGGQAHFSGVGSLGTAFTAAGGLLGPAIAGGIIIVAGSREDSAQWVLTGLAIVVVASVVLVVRNSFGFISLSLIAAALVAVALYGPLASRIFVAQLIGIQFCLASWSSLDYMFTKHFERDGKLMSSDTQQIADALVLPYWVWGGLVALLSFAILAASFYLAWVRPLGLLA